ncbi:MAG TPA: hypothetical protein VGJ36_02425, partial [Gemmatimonadales bacterium]
RRVLTLMKDGDRAVLVIVPVAGGAPRPVLEPRAPSPRPGSIWAWSADGRFINYIGQDPADKKAGIWRVPAAGGPARLSVWFDKPSGILIRPWFKVRGSRIYFVLGDQQSDVWITEVVGSR